MDLDKILDKAESANINFLLANDEYEIKGHEVNNKTKRRDKSIQRPTYDSKGIQTGVETHIVELNRLTIPFQKLIVNRRVFFMNLDNIKIYSDADKNTVALERIQAIRKDVKYRFKIKEIAKRLMSELQVAELWELSGGKPRLKVLSPKLGYHIVPLFDPYGDMISIAVNYKDTDGNDRMDVYDKEMIHQYVNGSEGWTEFDKKKHGFKKIPLIYYSQNTTEWSDIQPLINRLETLLSNFADTNDYNGSPLMMVYGKITQFANKGETGKILELEKDAKAEYLSWKEAPEAIKLEIETLFQSIYTFSNTPDMSMEKMRGLGVSGEALDRVFLDAQLSAQDKLDGVLGEGLQRSVNLLLSHVGSSESLEVTCEAYRFNSLKERIEILSKASGGKQILPDEVLVKESAIAIGYEEDSVWKQYQDENDLADEEDLLSLDNEKSS